MMIRSDHRIIGSPRESLSVHGVPRSSDQRATEPLRAAYTTAALAAYQNSHQSSNVQPTVAPAAGHWPPTRRVGRSPRRFRRPRRHVSERQNPQNPTRKKKETQKKKSTPFPPSPPPIPPLPSILIPPPSHPATHLLHHIYHRPPQTHTRVPPIAMATRSHSPSGKPRRRWNVPAEPNLHTFFPFCLPPHTECNGRCHQSRGWYPLS